MKIKITANPITAYGSFSRGDILSDDKYPVEFLNHLVNDCGAAIRLDYETKVVTDYEPKKTNQSIQSSEPDKALKGKTRRGRPKKQQ